MSSELRAKAREKLTGKWGKAVGITFAYLVIVFLISFIQAHTEDQAFLYLVVSIIAFVIEIPLSFGLMYSFYKLFRNEETSAFDFCSLGFSNFGRSWRVTGRMISKMIGPMILIIIAYILIMSSFSMFIMSSAYSVMYSSSSSSVGTAGVLTLVGFVILIASSIWATTKMYYYMLSYLIAMDNPEMTAKETVEESRRLMTNNRAKLFWLQLSFIGWAILNAFTFGIGSLWLIPYIQFAIFSFYDKVREKNA